MNHISGKDNLPSIPPLFHCIEFQTSVLNSSVPLEKRLPQISLDARRQYCNAFGEEETPVPDRVLNVCKASDGFRGFR